MIKLRFFSLLISLLIVGFFILFPVVNNKTHQKAVLPVQIVAKENHPALFYDENAFAEGITKAEKDAKKKPGEIFAAVVPHHLFVSFEIATVLKHLASQQPTTLLMIGPNHYEKGNYNVLTSVQGWETPQGIVMPNHQLIQQLLDQKSTHIDEQTLENDHALSGLMPYVKYYLPNVTVAPMLLSGYMTYEETKQFSAMLTRLITPKTVLMASVDFSHYLPKDVAAKKDELTKKIIANFDARQLFYLNNNYLDSPPSLATVFLTMQQKGATKYEMLYHTNSGELLENATIPTTTHFAIEYYK